METFAICIVAMVGGYCFRIAQEMEKKGRFKS